MASSAKIDARVSVSAARPQTTDRARYLFYRSSGELREDTIEHLHSLPAGYFFKVWRACPTDPWPDGSDLQMKLRFAFRWLLRRSHFFANREVGAVCIYQAGRLVHYSGYTPRYWRFPFLRDEDLQIGDTWTHPAHRGKRLASFALHKIIAMKRRPGRGFWYVVGSSNAASIRVVEHAHFQLIAQGGWRKPMGIRLLGAYLPDPDAESSWALTRQML